MSKALFIIAAIAALIGFIALALLPIPANAGNMLWTEITVLTSVCSLTIAALVAMIAEYFSDTGR